MTAIIQTIESVEAYGENLSIVTTSEGNKVIANKKEDGSFRWTAGELVAYVSEGSILPEDVLKDRGYWDTEKNRGLLDGGPRNRVKMKKLAGFESRGLLFKVDSHKVIENAGEEGRFIDAVIRYDHHEDGMRSVGDIQEVKVGDDVSEFFGITEFQG
jgi:hypothetical protein